MSKISFNKALKKLIQGLKNRLRLTITGVQTDKQVISLTFDDGPDPVYTPVILDLLDKHNAKATFFFVGKSAAKYPDIVERVALSGHEIGNHTWSHKALPFAGLKEQYFQIKKMKDQCRHYDQKYFRPPWGYLSINSYIIAKILGYDIIYWSFAARDWLDIGSDEIFTRMDELAEPGSIILMHDTLYHSENPANKSRSSLINALDNFLQKHITEYKFVTVSELISEGKPIYTYGIHRKKEINNFIPAGT